MSEQVHHPIFARLYVRLSPRADAQGAAEHRRELLAGVTGRVLELGTGNGLTFPHYPPTVTEVVAVEPENYLRARAVEAPNRAPALIHVTDGFADALPFRPLVAARG